MQGHLTSDISKVSSFYYGIKVFIVYLHKPILYWSFKAFIVYLHEHNLYWSFSSSRLSGCLAEKACSRSIVQIANAPATDMVSAAAP